MEYPSEPTGPGTAAPGTNREPAARIDGRLPTPLYHQIYTILRNRILDGEYPKGSLLPGEAELTRTFEVSRITAKRALNELAAEALVVRERGRGTLVVFDAPNAPVQSSVEGLIENLLEMGLKTEVEVLDFAYVEATAEVARALGCEAGAMVQRATRVRRLDGAPFSHLTTYVPEDLARSYSRDDLAATPLLSLLERCGVEVSSANQTIDATASRLANAAVLAVEVGAPLLAITRVVYDQQDRPVEYIKALYRPDRYRYQRRLNRISDAERRRWTTTA